MSEKSQDIVDAQGYNEPFQIRDARVADQFYVDNVIIDRYGAELGPQGVAVYCALCWREALRDYSPSVEFIAGKLGCSTVVAQACIDLLVALDLIYVEEQFDSDGSPTSPAYGLMELESLQ